MVVFDAVQVSQGVSGFEQVYPDTLGRMTERNTRPAEHTRDPVP
jgi:hypothetical protein